LSVKKIVVQQTRKTLRRAREINRYTNLHNKAKTYRTNSNKKAKL